MVFFDQGLRKAALQKVFRTAVLLGDSYQVFPTRWSLGFLRYILQQH